MPLREGDTVTVICQASANIIRFHPVKPYASITRVLGDDPEADYTDAQDMCRKLFWRSLALEVELFNTIHEDDTSEGNSVGLLELAKEQLDGTERPNTKITRRQKARKKALKARRKKARKKALTDS